MNLQPLADFTQSMLDAFAAFDVEVSITRSSTRTGDRNLGLRVELYDTSTDMHYSYVQFVNPDVVFINHVEPWGFLKEEFRRKLLEELEK